MFALAVAGKWMALTGRIPLWAGMVVNTVFIYGIYTVVHEAVHANISSRRKDLRWTDTLAGMIACAPLWLFYHQHRRQHMAHHTHTNEECDPDIYARGSFPVWVFVKLPVALINYFNPVQQYRDCVQFGCTRRETVYTFITFALYAAVLIGLLAAGYWKEVLLLWFIPCWIGQTVMLTFFIWTPHHDHSERALSQHAGLALSRGEFPDAGAELSPDPPHGAQRALLPLQGRVRRDAPASLRKQRPDRGHLAGPRQ